MKSNRIGFLAISGSVAAILAVALILGVGVTRGGVLFSPGKLSEQSSGETWGGVQSHAETAGDCAACHASSWWTVIMEDRCLACHLNIAETLRDT